MWIDGQKVLKGQIPASHPGVARGRIALWTFETWSEYDNVKVTRLVPVTDCVADEPGAEISCTDGVDNDCDALTDGEDPDCVIIGDVVFLRGDANTDAAVNLPDAQFMLNFLFLGGPDPRCNASGDANSDGDLNLADAQFILNFLFLGGPNPKVPFPLCGSVEGNVDCGFVIDCGG